MGRFVALLVVLSLATGSSQALAASERAQALREENDLVRFTPPESFLQGGFIASEMSPDFVYGPVATFASGRECPTTWLIEKDAKLRADKADPAHPVEYTLYLEEDCPDKTLYYVFLDQSGFTPQQWLEWRRAFHKRKAESEYAAVTAKLEKALRDGVAVRGELRFLVRDGEVMPVEPEKLTGTELKMEPLYDLKREKRLPK
ncbi:hypothetical protein JCM15519_36070 [Fundidesulfovibrio butyratiphilus]